jgi:hypothetical protein
MPRLKNEAQNGHQRDKAENYGWFFHNVCGQRFSSPMAAHRERSNCKLTPLGRHSVQRMFGDSLVDRISDCRALQDSQCLGLNLSRHI